MTWISFLSNFYQDLHEAVIEIYVVGQLAAYNLYFI